MAVFTTIATTSTTFEFMIDNENLTDRKSERERKNILKNVERAKVINL
jgi:hypothetical protein